MWKHFRPGFGPAQSPEPGHTKRSEAVFTMKAKTISKLQVKRLELYLDYLKTLPDTTVNISATAIAKALDLGHVQVRKDLARVSDGGRCRTGHVRERLIRDIEHFLISGTTTSAIVVGVGKLGQALMVHPGFEAAGIRVAAGFDIAVDAASAESGTPVYPMDQLKTYCETNSIQIGIIAVPEEAAQDVCNTLVACGIQAIWNFAPVRLIVPEHIVVQNENLAISATTLRLQLQ